MMIYYRKIPAFRAPNGKLYRRVVLFLDFQDQMAVAAAYLDHRQTVALVPHNPLRFQVRSASYESDPMPVANAIIAACIGDLLDGLFAEKPAVAGLPWTLAMFEYPKASRWAGWTPKIRRIANEHLALMRQIS